MDISAFKMLELPRKYLVFATAWVVLGCPMAFAQGTAVSGAVSTPSANATASPAPSFDVATIKPHPGMLTMIGVMNTPDGVDGSAATLPLLIQYAYGLRTEDQVSGGPDWAKTDRFDVHAKMSEADIAAMDKLSPAEKTGRRALMFQALLAERFKLKTHSETKQIPVYDLVVAKGGSKLRDSATDSTPTLGVDKDGKPQTRIRSLKDTSIVQAYSMKAFADFLSQPAFRAGPGRPVLDKTGLTATYDFTLNWSLYMDGSPDNAGVIFDALREVGLKLQPSTGPVEMIVIDHVERPTEN